ncbi:virion structural protein [Erwinia phage vB_EamM_Desertfox]|uniref:Putative virion structural protein n=1 Tax=Erwinia phage vB_EamM_Desertfox TaxID=2060127 RepID=A0A2H5BIX7_9CAUD|nr:virion structural protein [Erwinia phage vB_EamM_Desertfox]AUG86252.1 putative virion structural protein [Erwinia phage vB_EamM_Desertfox]
MKTILGFSVYPSLNNNQKGVTNPIGEISQLSMSFSRDIGTYTNTDKPGTALLVFTAVDENNVAFQLANTYSLAILSLQAWMLVRIADGRFTNDKTIALQQIKADFDTSWENLAIGDMITDGKYWAPEWVSGKLSGSDDNTIKIWLSDESFELSYPRYELFADYPVPLSQIDVLHEDYATAKTAIDSVTKGDIAKNINAIMGINPPTFVRDIEFKIYDKENTSKWQTGYFTIVGYGKNGNNDDAIYELLKADILANSKFGEDEWALVIPDLFNPIEYVIAPDWRSYSIPNKTTEAGTNSPVVDYETMLEMPTKVMKWYPADHIKASLQVFPALHKSLALYSVAKPTNRGGQIKLKELYPDYALLPSDDVEFDRISPDTQAFIFAMQQMLIAAETMSEFSELPSEISRVVRDGVICAAKSVNGIKFLVVAKPYVESLYT